MNGLSNALQLIDEQQADEVTLSRREIVSLRNLVNEIIEASSEGWQNGLVVRRKPCPPFCPPNPCGDDGGAFRGIRCMPKKFSREMLQSILLPSTWSDNRTITLIDANNETLSTVKSGTTLEDAGLVKYTLDIPETFTEGTIVIAEVRDGRKAASRLTVEIPPTANN